MEEFKISKEKMTKIKDGVLFVLLFLWMIMPILQSIKIVYKLISISKIYFSLMNIIGIVGIGISVFEIYTRIKNAENKKQVIKELLPIFIFVLYMIWTLIPCILSPHQRTVYQGTVYRKEGYYMYLNYAGFFLCAFLLKSEKLRKILLNTFVISSIFLITVSRLPLINEKLGEIFVKNTISRSIFAQFNHYCYFLMMSLMCSFGLCIKEKNNILKVLYLIAFIIIGYAMIYNNTFGCYLAVSTVLIIYGIYSLIKKENRKNILILITIFILLSCFTTKNGINVAYKNIKDFTSDISIIITKVTGIQFKGDQKENKEENKEKNNTISDKQLDKVGTSRMLLWKAGIKFISKEPVFGYGPDNLGKEYILEGINGQDRPHNLIIYLACVSGIPGMLIYMTAVGMIVIKGVKKIIQKNKEVGVFLIIVVTYLISSMFGNSMYYTSPYFFIFLGSLMKLSLEQKE